MRSSLAIILLALSSQPVPAQSTTPEHYQPLAFLVGSCWTGTFPNGKATDEKCFEWVFDRKFIRERHIVRGQPDPYAGETLFAWDPKAKRVVFTYWNSLGGVSTGSAEYGTEGIVFPERHVTDSGVREMKAVWKQLGPDRYSVWQGEKAGGQWKTLWTMEFRRLPAGFRN